MWTYFYCEYEEHMTEIKLTQRSIRKLIQAFARSNVPQYYTEEDWFRADGTMICSWCGYSYMEHPDTDFPTLVRLCDGQRVKV